MSNWLVPNFFAVRLSQIIDSVCICELRFGYNSACECMRAHNVLALRQKFRWHLAGSTLNMLPIITTSPLVLKIFPLHASVNEIIFYVPNNFFWKRFPSENDSLVCAPLLDSVILCVDFFWESMVYTHIRTVVHHKGQQNQKCHRRNSITTKKLVTITTLFEAGIRIYSEPCATLFLNYVHIQCLGL